MNRLRRWQTSRSMNGGSTVTPTNVPTKSCPSAPAKMSKSKSPARNPTHHGVIRNAVTMRVQAMQVHTMPADLPVQIQDGMEIPKRTLQVALWPSPTNRMQKMSDLKILSSCLFRKTAFDGVIHHFPSRPIYPLARMVNVLALGFGKARILLRKCT